MPNQLCQSQLQIADIQKNTKSAQEEEYLLQLISETFGEYMNKQSQIFQSTFRKLRIYRQELDAVGKKAESIKEKQEYIQHYFHSGLGQLQEIKQCIQDLEFKIQMRD